MVHALDVVGSTGGGGGGGDGVEFTAVITRRGAARARSHLMINVDMDSALSVMSL